MTTSTTIAGTGPSSSGVKRYIGMQNGSSNISQMFVVAFVVK